MKVRRCLLVDDSPVSLLSLETHLTNIPSVNVVGKAGSYTEAVAFLAANEVDMLFLDIELPDSSGLDLLKNVPDLPPTILVSSHPYYASESYEIGVALDYVVKPFTYDRILTAVNRVISSHETPPENQDFVFLKMGRKFIRFELDAIDYIEAYGIYIKVYTHEKPHVINETISSIQPLLKSNNFIRTHKSYIVNINKVTSFGPNEFYINENRIPIGISYKPKMEGFFKILSAGNDKNS